jgi:arginine exporter protein ArgO
MTNPHRPAAAGTALASVIGPGLWLIGAAYLVAALVGLPLFGDGGYYFLTLAADRELLFPNLRYTALIPQLPGWVATHWSSDPVLLRHIFSISYQSLPWLSLMACWLIVRRRAPWLMLLPLLGALGNLINFSSVSELLSSVYLTWPLVLAMALSPERRWVQIYALLAGPLLLALHPMAMGPTFALAAAALLLAWQSPRDDGEHGRTWTRLGLWLALFGVLRLLWTVIGANPYERGNLSPGGMAWYLLTETPGQHLLLGAVLTTGVAVAWVGWRGAERAGRLSNSMLTGLCALTLLAAVAVAVEFLFGHGIKLKAAAIFVGQLGLMGLGFLAVRFRIRAVPEAGQTAEPNAAAGIQPRIGRWLIGAILLLILAKSAAWWTATRNLQTVLASPPAAALGTGCIPFGPEYPYGLQWPWMQIIDDWVTPMNALAFRPRVPTADGGVEPVPLLLPYDGCEVLTETGEAHLTSWAMREWARLNQVFGPLRPIGRD